VVLAVATSTLVQGQLVVAVVADLSLELALLAKRHTR
jgi:hypothetical protein